MGRHSGRRHGARRVPGSRRLGRSQEGHRRGHRARRETTRKYPGGQSRLLRAPRGHRAVPGRHHDRRPVATSAWRRSRRPCPPPGRSCRPRTAPGTPGPRTPLPRAKRGVGFVSSLANDLDHGGSAPLGQLPSWRALAANACHEMPVLSVTEHGQALICRLMPASAAYDPTRVAVATYAVPAGIWHNRTTRHPVDADLHPRRSTSGTTTRDRP